MLNREIVKLKISKKTGVMTVETDGFIGEGCAAIEEIERQMGTVSETHDKEERFQYEIPNPNPLTLG